MAAKRGAMRGARRAAVAGRAMARRAYMVGFVMERVV